MDFSKFVSLKIAVGRVVSKEFAERVRVAVQLNRFNELLCVYFPDHQHLEVYDPSNTAKIGDIVLLKKLDTPRLNIETHEVKEVVFTAGHIVDPLTGLRVEKDKYMPGKLLDDEMLQQLAEEIKEREIAPKHSFEVPSKLELWEQPMK